MKKILISLLILSLLFLAGCAQKEVVKEDCNPVTIEKEVLPNSNSLKISPIEEGYHVEVNIGICKRLVCEGDQTFTWCWDCPE